MRAVAFVLEREDLTGPVNLCAPNPVPQRDLMRALRSAWGARFAVPATASMARLGAFVLGTDAELLLKSRRVVPGRLLDAGFTFEHPCWDAAAADLAQRSRDLRGRPRSG